jgi:hypothetical protein
MGIQIKWFILSDVTERVQNRLGWILKFSKPHNQLLILFQTLEVKCIVEFRSRVGYFGLRQSHVRTRPKITCLSRINYGVQVCFFLLQPLGNLHNLK